MSKKNKRNWETILNGFLIFIGLIIIFNYNLSWQFLIGLLIFAPLVSRLIFSTIQDKEPIKKSNKNKPSSKKNTTKKEKTSPSTTKKEHNLLRTEREILNLPLEELSWREFERLCFLYYKAKGYKPRETSEGADGGIDLIIYNRHHQQNVAIQIKHYIESGRQVTVKEIRELDSAKKNYKCILAEFISSTGYTNDALVEADKRKIKCHTVDKILLWREEENKKRQLI
ncbi:MAG: restriction endonuclease [Bacillota bacterium]|nr:restriction endonuclease [Bacillota bacterium]